MAYGGYSVTGGYSESSYCTAPSCQNLGINNEAWCADFGTVYIGSYAFKYCGACKSGYVSRENKRAVPGTSCQITFTSCEQCPSPGVAGGTEITSCYIPAYSNFSDSTGSGQYTGKCYYKL